eukprot:2546443-Amphidinium_carterae.1
MGGGWGWRGVQKTGPRKRVTRALVEQKDGLEFLVWIVRLQEHKFDDPCFGDRLAELQQDSDKVQGLVSNSHAVASRLAVQSFRVNCPSGNTKPRRCA